MANPKIGFLHSGSEKAHVDNVSAFHRGLAEAGYVDDDDVDVSYGWADDDMNKLAALAAQFVSDRVKVIVAAGGPISAVKAKAATATIPIVFTTISDPRGNGLVSNYDEPGDNLTGTAGLTSELDPNRLELLRELKPTPVNIGVLKNPTRPNAPMEYQELDATAKRLAKVAPLNLISKDATNLNEIEAAFNFFSTTVDAVLVTADQLFNNRRKKVVKLARQIKKPAIYQWRDFVEVRGLMSYGPNIKDAYYQTGVYVGRILDGEKVARLPVVFPDKFELVINLRTANKLGGLTIPASLLTRAILVRHP